MTAGFPNAVAHWDGQLQPATVVQSEPMACNARVAIAAPLRVHPLPGQPETFVMPRLALRLLALLIPIAFGWSPAASAASCSNGKILYGKTNPPAITQSCASCHGAAIDKKNIQAGAGSPSVVNASLSGGVSEMNGLKAGLGLVASDIDDLAEYIKSGPVCPVSAPSVSASLPSVDFGNVSVGATAGGRTVTISNTGGADATAMAYPALSAPFARTTNCAATLAAGGTCTVTFTFAPTVTGATNASFTVTGAGGISVPIPLSGTGVAAPTPASLQATPATLAFGAVAVGTSAVKQTVTVSNAGGIAATSVAVANSNAARFAVSNNTCGPLLANGASCTLDVVYSPAAVGADSGTLAVSHAGGTPVAVAMTGSGTAPPSASLAVTPSALAFGSVTVGTTSAIQAVTISNNGGGPASGLGVANSNAAVFPVGANTCGTTLAAGASCTVSLTYQPAAAGAATGALTISRTGGASIDVALSGTGVAAAQANLQASPATVAFGTVVVGQASAATTITVSNAGGAAAAGVGFSNSNGAEFPVSANTCGATIAAGASCTLAVAFQPAAAGPGSATLLFTYGSGGGLSVGLSGTGSSVTPPPGSGQLSLPTAVALPDTDVGSASAPRTVTISNTGSAMVAVTSITSGNTAEFAVSDSTCGSLGAGAACTFAVTFRPAAVGARAATIVVASNGAGSPQSLSASGMGTSGTAQPTTATAVEYYHAAFDHYFVTAIADEIAKIDAGVFVGWARTGRSFAVYTGAGAGRVPVCRFFSAAFAPKSSHFYTASASECVTVKSNPDWQFEGEVFFVGLPAADASATCAAGTIPVYRLYNNGMGASPNHRFTVELETQGTMIAAGWVPEGYGVGVTMCVPR